MNATYCDLKQFSKDFRSYSHIYLSCIVCSVGTVLNILNAFVLTTKQMRCPTNYILSSLAVADVLVMAEYVPFAYLQDESSSYFTYNFASFVIFHAVFTNAFHFVSCCLAIILAVWRYIAVKFPQNNAKWCGEKRTKLTIFLTYFLCPFICIPLILSMEIKASAVFEDRNGKIVFKSANKTGLKNTTIYLTGYRNTIFKDISFYVYGVVLKLIPCIALVVLSTLLIVELLKAKQRKKNLHGNVVKHDESMQRKPHNQRHHDKEKQFDRTTKMLLAVLLLFLMAEFPQAIFGLLHHIFGEKFYKECYVPLGDLLDIFTLTNSAINFVLYCIMSQKFRQVFREMFFPYLPCGKQQENRWISFQTVNTLV